jgi:hypothetical protein
LRAKLSIVEIIHQVADMKVFYVKAKSFPEGINESHEKIHQLAPSSAGRKFFGLSRPENGSIIYLAAAEEMEPGESEKINCPCLILKKGAYISDPLKDYMNDLSLIGKKFNELLKQPGLDPEGYCVEWYLSDREMNCMVRLGHDE